MATAASVDRLADSYEDYSNYPKNLIVRSTYLEALEVYRNRLHDASSRLFVTQDAGQKVAFRDWLGQSFDRKWIRNDNELKAQLGDQRTRDPLTGTPTGSQCTKRDPLCRFVFLSAKDSRSSLYITPASLSRLLSFHQVMPQYLDSISVFGARTEEGDLAFSGFREQLRQDQTLRSPSALALGRSGSHYQICYNFKTVDGLMLERSASDEKQWSIRQAAIHHQFDVKEGRSVWIITQGSLETQGNLALKKRIESLTGPSGDPSDRAFSELDHCFRSSLAVHALCGYWASEPWRHHVQWLESSVEEKTQDAVYGNRIRKTGRYVYTADDLQTVQWYEDKANKAILVMESNLEVLRSLNHFYEDILERCGIPQDTARKCAAHIYDFRAQTKTMISETKENVSRAKLVVKLAAERKTLILQHLQSQATEKMEDMTGAMHQLGIHSQREAIAMRIVTVVTVIYLPATFVSTFFSTDIIRYQNGKDIITESMGGTFSSTALWRWLEVTLPLTLLTLAFCLAWYWRAKRSKALMELPF